MMENGVQPLDFQIRLLILVVCKNEMKKRGIEAKFFGFFSHKQNGIVDRWLKKHLLIFSITKQKESLKGWSNVTHDKCQVECIIQ